MVTVEGFRRENGRVGVRNHVALIPVDDLSNAACQSVEAQVAGTLALPHAYGRLQYGEDLELHFRTMIGTGANPNVAAAVVIGLGAVLVLCRVLGIVAVRVKGISFVIITLAMGQVLWGLAYQWVGLSEGDNGIPLAALPSIGPFDLNDPLTLRMTVLAVFAVVALLLVTFVHSPFGLSLRGIRSNETRLAALGYRTGLHCYLAWVIAVFFTGVAGVLYVFVNQLISPTTMAFSANGLFVLMVVLGGLGSIWGPALGAVVIVLFQQELSIYLSRWQTLMGLTLIAVVLFSPGGLWGVVRAIGRRRDALIARLEETS